MFSNWQLTHCMLANWQVESRLERHRVGCAITTNTVARREFLANIRVPTLLLTSREDPLIPVAMIERQVDVLDA